MTEKQAQQLQIGVYVLHWNSGGASLATVGQTHSGARWFAPANWVFDDALGWRARGWVVSNDWGSIERVEAIRTAHEEADTRSPLPCYAGCEIMCGRARAFVSPELFRATSDASGHDASDEDRSP